MKIEVKEIKNLDNDVTMVFADAFRAGVRNARKAWGDE